MNHLTEKRVIKILLSMLILMLVFSFAEIWAGDITFGGGQVNYAPVPIPIIPAYSVAGDPVLNSLGNTDRQVPVTRLKFTDAGVGNDASFMSITLQITGTFTGETNYWTYIDAVDIYYDADGGGGAGKFDGGSATEVSILTSPTTFSAGTQVFTLDETDPVNSILNTEGAEYLFAVVEFAANTPAYNGGGTPYTFGIEITSVTVSDVGLQTGQTVKSTPGDYALHGGTTALTNIDTSLDVAGQIPADPTDIEQGTADTVVLKLEFTANNQNTTGQIETIKVHRTGAGTADSDLGSISLYQDISTVGTWEGTGTEQFIHSQTLGNVDPAGYATLDLTVIDGTLGVATRQFTDTAGTYIFYITADVDVAANITDSVTYFPIGLEIEDPKTDIIFDEVAGTADANIVFNQYAYIQTANVTTSGIGYFTIIAQAVGDSTPPTVVSTSPANSSTGINVNSSVTVTFSEDIDSATLTGNYTVLDVTNGNTDVTTDWNAPTYDSPSQTATFTLVSGVLLPSNNYQFTLEGGTGTGIKDPATNELAANYQFPSLRNPGRPC